MPLQLLLFYGQNVLKFCLLALSGALVSSFRNLAQPWDIIVTKMTGLTLLVLGRVVTTGLVWSVSLTPAGLNNIFLFAAVR